jgi:hypothetical protein
VAASAGGNGPNDRARERFPIEISIAGVGNITLEELEARFRAYMNAGAPEPVLEGTREERKTILEHIARRGDAQMRALAESYLEKLNPILD